MIDAIAATCIKRHFYKGSPPGSSMVAISRGLAWMPPQDTVDIPNPALITALINRWGRQRRSRAAGAIVIMCNRKRL